MCISFGFLFKISVFPLCEVLKASKHSFSEIPDSTSISCSEMSCVSSKFITFCTSIKIFLAVNFLLFFLSSVSGSLAMSVHSDGDFVKKKQICIHQNLVRLRNVHVFVISQALLMVHLKARNMFDIYEYSNSLICIFPINRGICEPQ